MKYLVKIIAKREIIIEAENECEAMTTGTFFFDRDTTHSLYPTIPFKLEATRLDRPPMGVV